MFKQVSTKDTKYENVAKYLIVYAKNEKEYKYFTNAPVKELLNENTIYNKAVINTLNNFNDENLLNYMFVVQQIKIVNLDTCFSFIVITNKELPYELLLHMNEMLHDEEEKSKNFLKMH